MIINSIKLVLALFLISISYSFGQNNNLSSGNTFDGEPFITINPTNSQHIAVAWMGYKIFEKITIKTRVSFDGGNSWSIIKSIPHISPSFQSADPSMAFDNLGNFVSMPLLGNQIITPANPDYFIGIKQYADTVTGYFP